MKKLGIIVRPGPLKEKKKENIMGLQEDKS